MAFPQEPLGVVTKLQIGTTMTDITPHVLSRNVITHTRGRTAEGEAADPASCSLTLKSPDGLYSPRNPRSPYYNLIGRNTPVSVAVHAGSPYLAVDGNTSGAVTPDAAPLDITGDLDIRADLRLDDWTLTAELVGKYDYPNQKSWMFILFAQKLWLYTSADGTTELLSGSTTTLSVPASGRLAVRATIDVDNGAGGRTVTFYTATSIGGTWTQLGNPIVTAGTTSIFSGTGQLYAGAVSTNALADPIGRFYAVEVRNGINGTTVANPDFTAQTIGATSFADGAGRTWTMRNGGTLTNLQPRFTGEFGDWPAEWSGRGDLITVEGEAAGILERMNQGTKTLASTLRRRIPSFNPIAYWPMEEGSDATTIYSPIAGVRPFKPTAFSMASDDTLPGSSALPALEVGASFVAPVPTAAAGPWQVELVYNLDVMPVATTTLFEVRTTGTARRIRARVATNAITLDGLDADGNTVFTQTNTAPNFTGSWNRLQIRAEVSGGNVTYVLLWVNIGAGSFQISSTIAADPGSVVDVRSTFGTGLDGMRLGHLAVFPGAPLAFNLADHGFNGETAAARMTRLCQEEGVVFRTVGAASETMPMGPQRPGTLLDLLQECADADGGIFGEDRDRAGLRYRARNTLYNQTPALTLVYGQPGLGRPLTPVDDTSTVRNDITVSRTSGGTARAVLEEGRLSVQAPPDGVGLYDEGVTLNLYDDDAPEPVAYWRLHLGTWDEARYPTVTVRLHRAPELIDAVLGITEGDKIRITDLPTWVPPGPVDLLVQGYTERIGLFTWEVDFVCAPAGPYSVAVLEALSLAWADTDGSELASAATATASTLDVLTTNGAVWNTNPSETPYDWSVGGEEVRVATGGRLINANPFFDSGITGWSGQNGGISWSTEFVHPQGQGSVFIAPNGVNSEGGASGALTAVGSVVPGATYIVSMWAYSPGGQTLDPSVDWYTAAGSYISTGFSAGTFVQAGKWTYLQNTVVAPANASRSGTRARHVGTPSQAQTWFAWAVRLTSAKASWLHDAFGRTSASGWGTSDSGLTWSPVGGSATDHTVGSGYGVHLLSTLDVARRDVVSAVHPDFDLYCDVTTSALATGDSLFGGPTARTVDGANMYQCRLEFMTSSTISMSIRKIFAGVNTLIGSSYVVPVTHVAGQFIRVRFQGRGTTFRAKAWLASGLEPPFWNAEGSDSALTAAAQIGTRSIRVTGNTNSAATEVRYENFDLVNPQIVTVDRARNGVVKAQAAGADVRLARPAIVAL